MKNMFDRFRKYLKYNKEGVNWFRTICFNFRMFPIRIAIRLPILLYGHCLITIGKEGRIQFINEEESLHSGSVRIGLKYNLNGSIGTPDSITSIIVHGTLIFGKNVIIGNGSEICVMQPIALCKIGDNCVMNHHGKICALEHVELGNNVRAAWDVQIFDTIFHYIADETGKVAKTSKDVIIGNNVWIGNRATIGKGSRLSDYSIVGSMALVQKDFSDIPCAMLGGVPAKLIKTGYKRIFSEEKSGEIHEFFLKNPNSPYFQINKEL